MESRLAIDLAQALLPLDGSVANDEALFHLIGDAPVVLIGESTHGTHEFYRARDVVGELVEIQRKASRYARMDGALPPTATSTPSRTRASLRAPKSITARCSMSRSLPGISAIRTCSTRSSG